VRMSSAAPGIPVTQGMPYSRAMMAPWISIPPRRSTIPRKRHGKGHVGVVASQTRISPSRISNRSLGLRMTRAGPRASPGPAGCPRSLPGTEARARPAPLFCGVAARGRQAGRAARRAVSSAESSAASSPALPPISHSFIDAAASAPSIFPRWMLSLSREAVARPSEVENLRGPFHARRPRSGTESIPARAIVPASKRSCAGGASAMRAGALRGPTVP
jgi:hypothetical protein